MRRRKSKPSAAASVIHIPGLTPRAFAGWLGVGGQFQTSTDAIAMSAFLPLATTERTSLEVRFVPHADMHHCIGANHGKPVIATCGQSFPR